MAHDVVQSSVCSTHSWMLFDLFTLFLVSYITSQLFMPWSHSLRYFFTAVAAVVLVVVVVVSLRIPQLPRSATDPVLEPNRVLVIAHRGGGHDAPENTIAAIREAKKNGADGVELDLEFTKDGVPILLHDSTVDRTTNGSGNINSFTFEEVRKLDASYGHRLSATLGNEQIPTLEEATVECLKLGLKIFFDVKGNAKQAAEALTKLYKKHEELYKTAAVCSFYPTVIYRTRLIDPNIVTALTHRTGDLTYDITGQPRDLPLWQSMVAPFADVITYWAHHSWLWYFCGNSAFLLMRAEVSLQVKAYWEARNIALIAWTVNDEIEKQYYENHLRTDYITDCLATDCGTSKYK
ncbi:glycerophosphodiester phosphodiesterase 1-like [Saccoglossus kowalevskii]|uniref:Glycerophosphodiester phosphodiesterase 1-like n=1 Tax=Saccoglossus kowalevskii TaxID=10224 RepID=A0ABM0LVN4_SACKO|nr:PREDICTED: glycerophosphodiester phosphodiesterase 1-like [Saccoglossus kowalevskii]